MAPRCYPNGTKLSQSVKEVAIGCSRSDSEGQDGDVSMCAPFMAAAEPSTLCVPAHALKVDNPQNHDDTQSLFRALAASLTSLVRKQQRVAHNDAPLDRYQQERIASLAAAARPAMLPSPVNAGVGDDVEVEGCTDAVQGMLGDARVAEPSYRADIKDLTTELILQLCQTAPVTEETSTTDPLKKILDIAQELRCSVPTAVCLLVTRTSSAPAANPILSATALAGETTRTGLSVESTGTPMQFVGKLTYGCGRLPRLSVAADSEPTSQRDEGTSKSE